MKQILLILSLLILSILSYGQKSEIQKGKVIELNSNFKPVPNVIIKVEDNRDANQTKSDANGAFLLEFKLKKPGDPILKVEARLEGYEVVKPYIPGYQYHLLPKEIMTICVAPKGMVAKIEDEIRTGGKSVNEKRYKKQIADLKEALKKEKISKEAYQDSIDIYYAMNVSADERVDELAQKWARYNTDTLDVLQKKALELYKTGESDKAIELYLSSGILDKVGTGLELRDSLNKDLVRKSQYLYDLATISETQNDEKSMQIADSCYRYLIQIDSTNFEYLIAYCQFCKEIANYIDGVQIGLAALNYCKNDSDSIVVYNSIAVNQMSLNENVSAYYSLKKSELLLNKITIKGKQFSSYSDSLVFDSDYNYDLATLLNNLGTVYVFLDSISEAISCFKATYELKSQLKILNPEKYQDPFAGITLNLGNFYLLQDSLEISKSYYEKALVIYSDLNKDSPGKYSRKIALILEKLGLVNFKLHLLEISKSYCKKSLVLYYELDKAYSGKYLEQIADVFKYLGFINYLQDSLEMAKSNYFESSVIFSNLNETKPGKYLKEIAIIYKYLGVANKDQDSLENAKKYFEKTLAIYSDLSKSDPGKYLEEITSILQYLEEIASNFKNLGDSNLNQDSLEIAEKYYIESMTIYEKIIEIEPKVSKEDLSEILFSLGELNVRKSTLDLAEEYLDKATIIKKELVSKDPQNKSSSLINILLYSAFVSQQQNDFKKAKAKTLEAYFIYANIDDKKQLLDRLGILCNLLINNEIMFGNIDSTKFYCEIAIELYMEGNTISRHAFDLNIANIYRFLSETIDTNRTEKIVHLKECFNFAKFVPSTKDFNKNVYMGYVAASLSYFLLFEKQFNEVIKFATEGLSLDSSLTWIYTNLAHAYLLNGEYAKAKEIYLKYKDVVINDEGKTFAEACLADFKELEKNGITHPDFEKIRILLKAK